MSNSIFNLSNTHIELAFRADNSGLHLERLASGDHSWLHPGLASGLFAVTVDDQKFDSTNLEFVELIPVPSEAGIRYVILSFREPTISVQYHLIVYADSAVVEGWPVIYNHGQSAVKVTKIDSVSLNLSVLDGELQAFSGDWGSEFEPLRHSLADLQILESRSGRSSKGHHPWFSVSRSLGGMLSGAVAWSGNWVFRFDPLREQGVSLSGGLHDWAFTKILGPGDSMEGAPVVLVLGEDMNEISQQYAQVGRRHWYPNNDLSGALPVEWNHWWPYEDAEINETVFARNVETAAQMGVEVCTLDAGWFGPSQAGSFWVHYRGDWHWINEERFPRGIRPLSDLVHARGMKFGIWCEIEALGEKAVLAEEHPEFVAARDGQRLGYVCFGNPQVQEWAYATLSRLINEYAADWIKLDFNLDPGAGCNRSDHGHQAGDGLYEHYRGYYRTLERIRQDFPEVVLENCSSGGLRIDLGMLRRTHMTFLSDPDWAVHDLQIFWGASTMLAPNVLLHWTFSDWRNINPPSQQNFNPHDPKLTAKKWDYYSRISMLGLYGLSQKLPDLPEWLAVRMAWHTKIYQEQVRRFVKEADLYRLLEQPRRNGLGERWAAFQYALPDRSEHLLFVFRLPGAPVQRTIFLKGLEPEQDYILRDFEGLWNLRANGRSLMEEGLLFSTFEEEESMLIKLTKGTE